VRKRLIVAVTFLGGIYFIIEFLLPEYFPSGPGRDGAWHGVRVGEYHEEILLGLQAVGAAAIGLGLINVYRVFGMNVLKRRKGWPFSLTLIAAMLAMMTVTFWLWLQELDTQHQTGPLGVQRECQTRILTGLGRTPPNPQAAQRMQLMRDAALQRYLADTRKAVSPPAVSAGDAAAQLAALANFLKGQGPAPAFFKVTDAPENPPEYGKPEDLLAPAKEAAGPLTLKYSGDPARLAQLIKQRDELADKLLRSSNALKDLSAYSSLPAGAVIWEQAAACREVAPELRKLAQEAHSLGNAERAAHTEDPDFDKRYVGGAEPPPVPMFGRLYLTARAMSHSADVLEKYAKVLDQAAIEIPRAKEAEQALSSWLAAQAQRTEALRQEWQKGAAADLERALPAVKARLSANSAGPDPLRQRMLEDLQDAGLLGADYDKALAELDATGGGGLWKGQETALRRLRVRGLEQDLNYLDLAKEDADKIVIPALSELAAAQEVTESQAMDVFQKVSAAAKQVEDDLSAQRKKLQDELDEAVRGLRKTWSEKTSIVLLKLREEQDARKHEIAALKTRAIVAAEAQKMADQEFLALAKTVGAPNARQAVSDGYLFVLQGTLKTMERFATKHDMKDLGVLVRAQDSMRALRGAVNSDSLLHTAASDAQLAARALEKQDLASARKAMESVVLELGQTQEGLKEALQERANRSVVKGLYKCLFDGLYVALGAAIFSLLAFYIASAAYRAFRVKSAEALLMMIAALLVMIGQIPFGSYISSSFPLVRLWVLQVFSTPAFRAIALGASVAGLAMAMRMWLSLETSAFYREEEEGA